MILEIKIKNLINDVIEVLKEELKKYTSLDKIKLFLNNEVPLKEIGICTGITNLIDSKLQEVFKNACILTDDTFSKFKNDLERDINTYYKVKNNEYN